MAQDSDTFSSPVRCGHCGNIAPMRIPTRYSAVCKHEDPATSYPWEAGDIYEVLVCPACQQVTFRTYGWNDSMESEADVTYKTLYPQSIRIPVGLPVEIEKAYLAAIKVKAIDSNAFAVLLGRVLERVCVDRSATGDSLHKRLSDLAGKSEIPAKLVDVAHGLRHLRNVGAHADLGELTSEEVPILDDLCRAILEYVYTAPHLAQKAQNAVKALEARRKKENGDRANKPQPGNRKIPQL